MPFLKTILLAGLCAILTFGVLNVTDTVCANADPDVKPVIVFDQLEHDFGNQVAGLILKHSFAFFNKGNAPLFIESVKAG